MSVYEMAYHKNVVDTNTVRYALRPPKPRRAERLKGLNTPRILIFMSGWHHARKGFIRIDEWGCMQSGFIKRKQEDFNAIVPE